MIYSVANNNNIIPVEYAHDSINLLSSQEMAAILQYEVVEKAYMEKEPRVSATQSQPLWIIGAVLGPVFFLIIVFWITGFLYYKCIRPTSVKKNPKPTIVTKVPPIKVAPNKPIAPKIDFVKVIIEFDFKKNKKIK